MRSIACVYRSIVESLLKLYTILEKLANRVLYYNTDSCVFISREGKFEPFLGPYLVELTYVAETCTEGRLLYVHHIWAERFAIRRPNFGAYLAATFQKLNITFPTKF